MNAWTPEHIKQLRQTLKLTQKAFAGKIGVSREYANLIEKGVKIPGRMLCILLNYVEQVETKMKKESDRGGKDKRNL